MSYAGLVAWRVYRATVFLGSLVFFAGLAVFFWGWHEHSEVAAKGAGMVVVSGAVGAVLSLLRRALQVTAPKP
jgi:hypothetical protein